MTSSIPNRGNNKVIKIDAQKIPQLRKRILLRIKKGGGGGGVCLAFY
jgi:hypothetical protein